MSNRALSRQRPAHVRLRNRLSWGEGLPWFLVTVALVCLLIGCQASETGESALDSDKMEPSGDERPGNEGWQDLLGEDLAEHWRGYKMEGLPAGWSLAEDILHFAAPEEGDRADLITKTQYEDFELALEWAVSPGGNSGIMFRVGEEHPASYHTGPEVQILDDGGHRDGQSPLTSAGSNYALHPPSAQVVRPVGEYNEVLLRVEGDRVTHSLNGVQIVDYQLWTEEWKGLVAASKFNAMPEYGLNKTGHLALQDHGNEVWFRNVRIRALR